MLAPSESEKRIDPLFAYVAPMALFMIGTQVEGWAPLAEYYPWVYAAKVAVVALVWWRLRKQYPAFSSNGVGLGIAAGVVGVVVWIGLYKLNLEAPLRELLPAWLIGARIGYDPFQQIGASAAAWAFVVIRMLGLSVVVPLFEEVFWRGFLLRYLIDQNFEAVPIGKLTPLAFAVATVFFALIHPELVAALAWGALINLLAWKTGNLWACIVAHGVTNFCLGVYVLMSKDWPLW